MNKDAKFNPQDAILLIQRVMVLLGNASHSNHTTKVEGSLVMYQSYNSTPTGGGYRE